MIDRMCKSLTLGDCVRLLEAVNDKIYNISVSECNSEHQTVTGADVDIYDADIYTAYCSLCEGSNLLKKILKQIKKDSK